MFLDLKKAFDTLDHLLLLSKLSAYKIQENAYNWLKSYLENRTLIINGSPITRILMTKTLGLHIDTNFSLAGQPCRYADQKNCLSLVLQPSIRVRQFVPPAALHLIYKALIRPHFDYCNVVWGNCGTKRADKLQNFKIVQRGL